jgi:hypothetical protein
VGELHALDKVVIRPPVVAHELRHAGARQEGLQPGEVGGAADEEKEKKEKKETK